MARKVILILMCAAIMTSALTAPSFAATHNVYTDGNISTTYVQYFKDILSGAKVTDDYVAFRSGQYEYTMYVGKLTKNGNELQSTGSGKLYKFSQSGNYNSTYTYNVTEVNTFSVNPSNTIIYSNVGEYPQLIERGVQIETLTLALIGVIGIFVLVDRILRHS